MGDPLERATQLMRPGYFARLYQSGVEYELALLVLGNKWSRTSELGRPFDGLAERSPALPVYTTAP